MKKYFLKILVNFCFIFIAANLVFSGAYGQTNKPAKNKTLIFFFDGLRPDYITAELMPNLFAFKQKSSVGAHHHSVFPTVTRVNSASYATGSYPGTHGLLGNGIYFPAVSSKAIGTTYEDLMKVQATESNQLLTAVSLGEVLESAGEKMMVFSSGTTGQAFLQNHKVGKGAIINPDLILPESFKPEVIAAIGELPEKSANGGFAKHKWVTDALISFGLKNDGPLVSAAWLSDPDGSAHKYGIGSPQAVSALAFVDQQFGRVLDSLKTRNLTGSFNIIISTDHGFVTHKGKQSLGEFLIKEGLKKDKDSDDVVLAEGAVYVKDHNEDKIKQIVEALHKQEWIGAVFTKPKKKDSMLGWVEGTLSFEAIHYNHPKRSGDILVANNWNDERNDKGYAGTDFSMGVAGHGGSSPYEINITLMVFGPDFKKGYTGALPTSNIDITPTVLGIYNLPVPSKMDGRIMTEFLAKTAKPAGKFKQDKIETTVQYPWGTYKLSADMSAMDQYRYFNFSKVERTNK